MAIGFDRYERRARLAPALIVVLPLIVVSHAIFRQELDSLGLVPLIGASGLLGTSLLVLFAHIARTLGKRLEKSLFSAWGGSPTVALLRHREAHLPEATRLRYHSILQSRIRGITLPRRDVEAENPALADSIYQTCVQYLLSQSRDQTRYYLVAEENRNYGFHRNLLGLKPIGLAVSAFSLGVSCWLAYRGWAANGTVTVGLMAVAVLSLAVLVIWISYVTPTSVREAGFAYARALLEVCEELDKSDRGESDNSKDSRRILIV